MRLSIVEIGRTIRANEHGFVHAYFVSAKRKPPQLVNCRVDFFETLCSNSPISIARIKE